MLFPLPNRWEIQNFNIHLSESRAWAPRLHCHYAGGRAQGETGPPSDAQAGGRAVCPTLKAE